MRSRSSRSIKVHASTKAHDVIERAAHLQSKTPGDFILDASTEAANEVLSVQAFRLDQIEMPDFEALMNASLKDNVAVAELLASDSPWVPRS